MDIEDRKDFPTGRQVQKARRTLGWNSKYLAKLIGEHYGRIENWECEYRKTNDKTKTMVRATLEVAGVRFLEDTPEEKDRVVWAESGKPLEEPPPRVAKQVRAERKEVH